MVDFNREPEWLALALLAIEQSKDPEHFGNFAYLGDRPLGVTWALTISQCRDSGLVTRLSFAKAVARMTLQFPADCEVLHCDHWACGWVDHLMVRMVTDDHTAITPAGKVILRLNMLILAGEFLEPEEIEEARLEALATYIGDQKEKVDDDGALKMAKWLMTDYGGEVFDSDGAPCPSEAAIDRAGRETDVLDFCLACGEEMSWSEDNLCDDCRELRDAVSVRSDLPTDLERIRCVCVDGPTMHVVYVNTWGAEATARIPRFAP